MSGVTFQLLLGLGLGVTSALVDHQHSEAAVFAGNSYTFSMSFGAADANRALVAVIDTNSTSITSVTIGGVTATNLVNTTGFDCRIVIANVPTGTSGNVVIAVGGNSTRGGVQLYRVMGLSSFSASSTATSTAAAPTATMNVLPGGALIAGAFEVAGSANNASWSGVTTNVVDTAALTVYSSGSLDVPGGNASLTATCTFSGGTVSTTKGVFAAFAP